MSILLGDLVFVSIHTKRHGITGVQGVVTATGEIADKPDAFWIQIAGLSATIYSDEAVIEKGTN
jgi:hypothetical protein